MTGLLAILRQTELRSFNTFGVAAKASEVALLQSQAQLAQVHAWLGGRTPIILGGGSNILITADVQAPILAVRLKQPPQAKAQPDGSILVHASAGLEWHALVRWTLGQQWAGLENLSLIPGLVGASPIQNIGAYGVELKDRLDSVTAWNWRSGEKRVFTSQACGLSYRDSFFKHGRGKEWIILSVCLKLTPFGERPLDLDYGDIRQHLATLGVTTPNAAQVSEAVCTIRQRKLPDPSVLGNAGSFFKNPLVSSAVAQRLLETHPSMPKFATRDSEHIKLSAAWLIDHCGWKGHREGDAGVHQDHALVLVNYGQASGTQLLELAKRIQHSVRTRFSVELEPEPSVLPVPL